MDRDAPDATRWRPRSGVGTARAAEHRVVALLPVPDAPPSVVLSLPVADTTYRTPPKTIVLEAKATDDIGLADGWFECIISAGESEGNFKSITDTIGHVRFSDSRTGTLRAIFSVTLEPGNQLSIRAIARDGNTVSGPGVGSSDTRTIRIARPEEYDSLAIAAAAPPILDKALMSQRMLVMQLEALVAKRQRPKSESVRLGGGGRAAFGRRWMTFSTAAPIRGVNARTWTPPKVARVRSPDRASARTFRWRIRR